MIIARANKLEFQELVEQARRGEITIRELRGVRRGNKTKETGADIAMDSKGKSLVKFAIKNDPDFAGVDKDTEIDTDDVEKRPKHLENVREKPIWNLL